ncbi:ATP-dependent RecD-like DNA helicase [Exiguobacterium sp. s140]|uniref:SF1B family DNA helicase RecD2 n=1 Tax=Exiguobacterium sp. s140 TaxID=2751290 RepID=UPI001BEBDC34|nr:ATP-dependent RecD-like DNA helicase [Exiguobacterium sp. s140]
MNEMIGKAKHAGQDNSFMVRFEIKKVMYMNASSKYAIVKAKLMSSNKTGEPLPKEMTVQGKMVSPFVGDVYEGEGMISVHPTFGRFIELTEVPTSTLPQVESQVIDFIKRKIKGVGKKKAERIVKTLGVDAISKISEDHKVLLECGFTELTALSIHEKLSGHREFELLVEFLQNLALESNIASPIYNQLKRDCVKKIKSNPYIICPINTLNFMDAEKVAYALGLSPENRNRYREALLYYISYRMERYGDICVPKDDMIEDFMSGAFLSKVSPYNDGNRVEKVEVEALLQELVNERFLITEDSVENGKSYVYDPGYYHIEENIIKKLIEIKEGFINPFAERKQIDDFLTEYESKFLTLATRQREAVYMALENRFSILTGGPGTGKTQTTNTIVKCIEAINPSARIRLLAPTGKASKRMTELSGKKAETIHRSLGMKGFGHAEELTPITEDFAIIDESSMIDAYLFSKLLQNISHKTRLIFVGDVNQLPSVGPGLVLRDLIESKKIPCVELNEIFRQAAQSQIVTNAHAIIKGLTTKDADGMTFDSKRGDSYFIQRSDTRQIQRDVIESMHRFMKKGFKMQDILILSAMRGGDLGVEELNRLIQYEFNPPTEYIDIVKPDGMILRVGDRVMQMENNYDLDVFNGDIGTILSIFVRRSSGKEETVIEVEFPDKEESVEYVDKTIEQLELAYAITIHKSQGSEAPIVIIPVHPTQEKMLDKNLVYTAYTRAKQVAIMFGDEELLNRSVKRINTNDRHSLIREKIVANL